RSYHSEPRRLYEQWVKARLLPGSPQRTLLRQFETGGEFLPRPGTEDWGNWMDAYGWNHHFLAAITPEFRRRATTAAPAQYNDAVGDFHLAPGPVRALHDLLDRCWQEGIPTALLLMPEGSAFQNLYTPAARAGLEAFLADLSRS